MRFAGGNGEYIAEGQRASRLREGEHRQQQADIAYAIEDEYLLYGGACPHILEPEADQQERGQAHALPADRHNGCANREPGKPCQ